MSRVGKSPIQIPAGVTVSVKDDLVTVKGPKGVLTQPIKSGFSLDQEASVLTIGRNSDDKETRSLHGLYRALVNNMVTGVSSGFELRQELVGVGYRVEVKGNTLDFALGFSHGVIFVLPPDVTAEADIQKGKNPVLILRSNNRQLIGQIAAKIRKLRPPEPYKGKGIRFVNEQIRRKAGKSSGKGK